MGNVDASSERSPMTDGEHSAVVALHRLSFPERNGCVVVDGNPVSELMRQAVVFIERWNAELNIRRSSPALMPPPSAWGSAARIGCTLRSESAWTGDDPVPSVDHQHRGLHGAGAEPVQGLLAGVSASRWRCTENGS
jgi:hypothetical protein